MGFLLVLRVPRSGTISGLFPNLVGVGEWDWEVELVLCESSVKLR